MARQNGYDPDREHGAGQGRRCRRPRPARDPAATRQWLFPSPLLRSRQALGHLGADCVSKAFRAWAQRIPSIDGALLGLDGTPAPFDRSLITPYALRHSYAQRHADAGVPVDVLRELMDHRSVQTTMGYYQVSLHRKQQAIWSVGSLATDAHGNPSPFADPIAYERASVSVPFGNCTEPSNVNAGGGPARSASNAPAAASTGPTPPSSASWAAHDNSPSSSARRPRTR